jgi:glycerophosphoryl diester phosphodiesterase
MRENTAAAFREAFARGADAVEMDVRRSADGVLVIYHDAVLPDGRPIVETPLVEISRISPWVPRLEEAIAACAGMWINLEIKNSPDEPDWDPECRTAHAVSSAIRDLGIARRVLVSSFHADTITVIAGVLPGVPTGRLVTPGTDPLRAVAGAAAAGRTTVHLHRSDVAGDEAGDVMEAAAEQGLLVFVWTVDEPATVVRLAAAGAAGIITNRPDQTRSALEHHHGNGG